MNDESVNDIMAYSPSRFARGFSNLSSGVKWSVIAFGTVAMALAIGWGSGLGIGNAIWGGDNNESSVSSAMAADFSTSDNNGSKSGKGEGEGAKSDKSAGVSYSFYTLCAHDMYVCI